MSKRPNLAQLAEVAGSGKRKFDTAPETAAAAPSSPPVAATVQKQEKPKATKQGRDDTVPVLGHFPRPVRNQLKMLAIELSMKRNSKVTIQGLLGEGINEVFAKYGKPEIAPTDEK